MIIKIGEQIESLRFRRKIAAELILREVIDEHDGELLLDCFDQQIEIYNELFEITRKNEYVFS